MELRQLGSQLMPFQFLVQPEINQLIEMSQRLTQGVAKCFTPIEKSNFFLIIAASSKTLPLAIKARTEIAAAQSKASTTLSSNRNETPQSRARIVNLVEISAFI